MNKPTAPLTERLAGFATAELAPVETLALAKALAKAAETDEALVADGTKTKVDVVVHLTADLSRGAASTRKPTSRALRKSTLALLIRRMGVTREAALELLAGVLADVQAMPEDAEAALLAEHPEVGEAFDRLDELVEKLPRTPTRGSVRVSNITLEKVL